LVAPPQIPKNKAGGGKRNPPKTEKLGGKKTPGVPPEGLSPCPRQNFFCPTEKKKNNPGTKKKKKLFVTQKTPPGGHHPRGEVHTPPKNVFVGGPRGVGVAPNFRTKKIHPKPPRIKKNPRGGGKRGGGWGENPRKTKQPKKPL